jgi:hypothetical protein
MLFKKTITLTILSSLFIIIFAFIAYIRSWEKSQPKFVIQGGIIEKITPYYKSGGDLHWGLYGVRVYIHNLQIPIDFSKKNWNYEVQNNTKVDLLVRRSFFGNELDGLEVKNGK